MCWNLWKTKWRTALLERVLRWQAGRGLRLRRRRRLRSSSRAMPGGGRPPLDLLNLLQPLLKRLLVVFLVVGIARRAVVAAPRLGLRLERFPYHRRLRVLLGREHAEYGLAARPVDPNPADSGRRDKRDLRLVLERGLRPLLEDRRGDAPALRRMAHRARVIVPEVDAGDDVGRPAHEPDVCRAGGRAGLAEQGPIEVAQDGGGSALHHAFQDVDHLERRHWIDQLPRAAWRPRHSLSVPVACIAIFHQRAAIVGAQDELAVAVLDVVDRGALHRAALIGEDRISVHQPCDGRVAGTERHRQVIRIFANAELLRSVEHLRHARFRSGADRHQVARLLDAPAHRLRTGVAAVEVDEAFIAEARALPHAERCIDDDRGGREAVFKRGDIDDRLERGAGLAERLRRTVEVRADDVEPALHREDTPRMHFLGKEAAADPRNRAQDEIARALFLHDDDHAWAEIIESRTSDAAFRHQCGGARQSRRRTIPETDARLLARLRQDHCLPPVREASADRRTIQQAGPVAIDVDALAQVYPAAAGAVEPRKTLAQRFGRSVLHHRVHRGADPEAAGVKAVRPVLRAFAELLDQLATHFLHEVAALLLELLVASVADGAKRLRRSFVPLRFADVAVARHLAQHIVATVERLLRGAHRVIVGWSFRKNRQVSGLRQRELVDVLVEIG